MLEEDVAIVKKLEALGYTNRIINEKEFLELYSPYKQIMSKKDFANVIGIKEGSYQHLKVNGRRVRILKRQNAIDRIKKEIKEELKQQGYTNQFINYKEFLQIYKPYRLQISKKDFATILGIDYFNILSNKKCKRRIVKQENIVEKRRKEILKELQNKGYVCKTIKLEEFLELYQIYKVEMEEIEFASIIGIKDIDYQKLKQGKRVTILKDKGEIKEERQQEILEELKEEGYTNQLINYQQFLKIYQSYKQEMNELEFANAIGIKDQYFKRIKENGTRTTILKEKNREEQDKKIQNALKPKSKLEIQKINSKITKQRQEEIRNEVRTQIYVGKSIDYVEFATLYQPYKNEMKEVDFACIVRISYQSYNRIKYDKKRKARILRGEEIMQEERKEEIIRQIKKSYQINQQIDYQEFLTIYEPYQMEIGETDFANLVGISHSNFGSIKYNGKKTKIFRKKIDITQQQKKQAKEIIQSKIDIKKPINNTQFLELYQLFKEEIGEIDFAKLIEMKPNAYKNLKKGGKVFVFKQNAGIKNRKQQETQTDPIIQNETETLRKAKIEKIRKEIRKNKYDKKFITQEEFLKLYQIYKTEIRKEEFLELLGITLAKQTSMKLGSTAKIVLNRTEIERIKYQLSLENRNYSRQELQDKCKKYNITLEALLLEIFKKDDIVEQILKRDEIYIGRCKIPKEFQEKYGNYLLERAEIINRIVSSKYKLGKYQEDFTSEALLYVLEKRGDVVKNAVDDQQAFNIIERIIYRYIKYQYCKRCKFRKKQVSLDKRIKGRASHKTIKSDWKIPEVEFTKNEEESNVFIKEIKLYYEYGMKQKEIIDKMMKKYGISKRELLEIVKKELINKNQLRETADGKVYLGEEL